jgi:hypothetical protein
MDGSTDDSVTEQETVFLRTCMEGKIVNRFVCIGEPKSTGSADLFAFVQDKLNLKCGKIVLIFFYFKYEKKNISIEHKNPSYKMVGALMPKTRTIQIRTLIVSLVW